MRVNKIIIVLSLAFTGSLLLSSGCGMMEKVFIDDLMPKRVSKNHKQAKVNQADKQVPKATGSETNDATNNTNKETNNATNNETNNKTIVNDKNKQQRVSEVQNKITNEKIMVTIFLADEKANELVPVSRKIVKVEGLAKAAINELIKGPGQEKKVLPVIPKGTKLLSMVIKDGVCYVDFSRELKDNHPGGSAGEYLTVYGIVKTLCQFSTIEKVQILIEGKVIPTLAGHLDLSQPLSQYPNN